MLQATAPAVRMSYNLKCKILAITGDHAGAKKARKYPCIPIRMAT
jgi:hypothetical protein